MRAVMAACRATSARLLKVVATSAVVLGLSGPRTAAAQEAAGQLPDTTQPPATREDAESGGPASRFGGQAFVRGQYTSNLYHAQERRLPQFETNNAAGQRFHRMRGPWDFATHIGLEGRYRLKLDKRRRFGASVGGSYALHARNPIADYLALWIRLRYDLTKRDSLHPEATFIPRRFRKNYHEDGAGGSLPFVPAYYLQVYPQLAYRHDWSKAWSTDVVYRFRLRQFEEPMANHSEARHEVLLRARHRFSKRAELAVGGGVGLALTPDELEGGGFSVDRSYQLVRGAAQLAVRPLKRFETGLELEYRFKRFTTNEAADTARFERRDHRVGIGAYAEQGLGEHVDVEVGVEWLRNLTNRSDPGLDADAFDYEEVIAGVGLRLTL
jgi:hypothetical protein